MLGRAIDAIRRGDDADVAIRRPWRGHHERRLDDHALADALDWCRPGELQMAQPVIDAIDNQTVPLPQLVAGEPFGQHPPDLTGSAVLPQWVNGIPMRRP